jgi:hypothetical protein
METTAVSSKWSETTVWPQTARAQRTEAGRHIWKTSHEAKKRGAGLYRGRDTRQRLEREEYTVGT